MRLKDLIGHTIIDARDTTKGEFVIKTDKGLYKLTQIIYPDGSLNETIIEELGR